MADFTNPRVTEKRFLEIPDQVLTVDGQTDGTITVASTYCFKVGQIVTVVSNAVQPRRLKIKAVPSETQIKLGPTDKPIYKFSDVSDLLVADSAMIGLVDDSINSGSQASNRRYVVDPWEQWRQVYEEEPTVAIRTHGVDWLGRSYSDTNPFYVGLSFIRDNQPQNVIEDTVTPANNRPLPVKLTGFAGDISFAVDNLNLETQLEGEYDAATNVNPDSVALIAHERSATTDDTHQTERPTAIRGTGADAQTVSQDVALHDHNGDRYSPTNPQHVALYGNDPEGTRISNIDDALKVASDSQTPIVVRSADGQTDAFYRMRVSNPINIFEYQFRYNVGFSIYWDTQNTNGATQNFGVNDVGYYLNGAAQAGSEAILQTRRYIEYVPGKSKQIFLTGNFNGASAEWIKRYGTFDNNNGIFFELNGLTPRMVIRSATSGTPVDNPIDQSNWNGDTLDGNGPSGETVDFTKQQLFFIDYAYLGTGDVRMGFVINGKTIIAHRFTHANLINNNYMQAGILPLRASITAIGTPTTPSTMQVSCVSVAVEGQESEIGRVRAGNVGTTAINFSATETFIFGLRINQLYPYSSVRGDSFQILPTSGNQQAIWRVYLNPTLTGATWVANPNSITESVNNAPTITGGILLASGYISLTNNNPVSIQQNLLSDIFIGRSIANISDTLVLTLQTTQGNGTALFAGDWKEIT